MLKSLPAYFIDMHCIPVKSVLKAVALWCDFSVFIYHFNRGWGERQCDGGIDFGYIAICDDEIIGSLILLKKSGYLFSAGHFNSPVRNNFVE